MIPLYHDFSEERVLIIGGGSVALRKARRFAEQAEVTAIAPSFEDGFESLPCELRRESVDAEELPALVAGAALVVPATDDPGLNQRAADAARDAGALVNRVDGVGDVAVPATVDSEEISVAISTHGQSPTTSRWLRQQLEPTVERADGMVRLQRDLREELKAEVTSQATRRRILRAVIDSEAVWEALEESLRTGKSAAYAVVERER